MSCHHQHEHEHDGHDGHNGHGHDHSHDVEPALQSNLYKQIQFDSITTLNEAEAGSGAAIVKKTWSERLNDVPVLESDADEQLLMYIPFTSSCKLYTLLIRGSATTSSPLTIHLFRNRDDITFATATDLPPTQSVTVPLVNNGTTSTESVLEIPLARSRWNTTTSVTLFVQDNHSGGESDRTEISYLGFRGDWVALNREPVHVLYEAAANPKDHPLLQGLVAGANLQQ